jgi:hypothetical protein
LAIVEKFQANKALVIYDFVAIVDEKSSMVDVEGSEKRTPKCLYNRLEKDGIKHLSVSSSVVSM